jgi:hypothetical protein
MRKLGKSTLANTLKRDCDRFLRLRLSTPEEVRRVVGDEPLPPPLKPAQKLAAAAGRRWEADRYGDLIALAGEAAVHFAHDAAIDPLIGCPTFADVELLDVLRRELPRFVLEGIFDVPDSISPAFEEAVRRHGVHSARARPDVVWIRPRGTGSPLMQERDAPYEIHVIDVKSSVDPGLRHFAEVAFYQAALEALIVREGLASRFVVSAEGFLWPGTHEPAALLTRVAELAAAGEPDPLDRALLEALRPVPFEVYRLAVRTFFPRMLRVLDQPPEAAEWFIQPACESCEYFNVCRKHALRDGHLSLIPGLGPGPARVLRKHGLTTVDLLPARVGTRDARWRAAAAESPQLRAEAGALRLRARAINRLRNGEIRAEQIEGRRSALMPSRASLSIFLQVQYDPGSRVSFALGASRLYFPPGVSGPPVRDEQVFVVDRMSALDVSCERERLVELLDLVGGWLRQASADNDRLRADRKERGERDRPMGKASAHVYVWDPAELAQLRRMFERHLPHPDIAARSDTLLAMFPPEGVLPSASVARGSPGTAVRPVVESLFALPLPHTYTLLATASLLFPYRKPGTAGPAPFRVPFGFRYELSDLVPSERAYEIWSGTVFLRRYDPAIPNDPIRWSRYTRDEIVQGLIRSVSVRLRALRSIVGGIQRNRGDLLALEKRPLALKPPRPLPVPAEGVRLDTFAKLNAFASSVENRVARSAPPEEREARYVSIRGLVPSAAPEHVQAAAAAADPRRPGREIVPYLFSADSREARIREGDFLLALGNEAHGAESDLPALDLDEVWWRALGIPAREGASRLAAAGLADLPGARNYPVSRFVQVELVRLFAGEEPPFLLLAPSDARLFRFAVEQGILDPERPMVLDPIYRDFSTRSLERVILAVG